MKKTVLKIYPSIYLLIATVVPCFICIPASTIWIMCLTLKGDIKSTGSVILDYAFLLFIFLSGFSVPVLSLCSEMKQWLERLHISANGMEIHVPFRKTKRFSYSDYSKVYYGYMMVRGIPEWFIIISNRTLSRFELTNLNKVKKTDAYVTIKYSEKRRKQLQEILPQKLAVQLKNSPKQYALL